jgi:zinc/manganese transport system permease protein
MVFALLIAPAVCGVFLGRSTRGRLVIAWLAGVLTCVVGIFASYHWDLPTGATIVCTFGITLSICGVLRNMLGVTGSVSGTH